MSGLTENDELHTRLEKSVQCKVHAIYSPEGNGYWGDCYCAAVDLFSTSFTFRVYFKMDENGAFDFVHVERWYFG